ncbi:MAG: hypothetical protein QOI55_2068, partial [Actinomycetota bacterium]|nr:hypothetical protein [Actinomycetota bacterium]
FGKAGKQAGPGLHVEWPITKMRSISVRTQSYTMAPTGDDPSVQVLGQDATVANADATLLFRVQKKQATTLYENIGSSYSTTVVRPSARTCARAEFAQFPMVRAATVDFNQVERNIDNCIRQKLNGTGISVLDFQLRELRLAPQVQDALDGVTAAKALGISGPLTPEYRQYIYILRFLQAAAKSQSTVVVTPNGGTGLNIQVTPSTTAPTTTTTPGK